MSQRRLRIPSADPPRARRTDDLKMCALGLRALTGGSTLRTVLARDATLSRTWSHSGTDKPGPTDRTGEVLRVLTASSLDLARFSAVSPWFESRSGRSRSFMYRAIARVAPGLPTAGQPRVAVAGHRSAEPAAAIVFAPRPGWMVPSAARAAHPGAPRTRVRSCAAASPAVVFRHRPRGDSHRRPRRRSRERASSASLMRGSTGWSGERDRGAAAPRPGSLRAVAGSPVAGARAISSAPPTCGDRRLKARSRPASRWRPPLPRAGSCRRAGVRSGRGMTVARNPVRRRWRRARRERAGGV